MSEEVKRLTPAPETLRRLYLLSGNQCAFPSCTHAIITADGDYVGELCHICAAATGGERFDEKQSNEDRRQFENLMLMCHPHHVITNDVDVYAPRKMREMKAAHEAKFDAGLASMMKSEGITIEELIILSLGGQGGSAPGAGGGGGGAIGPGAIGGRGGDGGEVKSGSFHLNQGDELRIHVGKGGEPGKPGVAGAGDGEDTFVEIVRPDGRVEELLRAKGGKGADREIGPVKITGAMLANSAEVRDALIFAIGAGWTKYYVQALPANFSFAVVFVAEAAGEPMGGVTLSLIDPKGDVLIEQTLSFNFSLGSSAPSVFNINVFGNSDLGLWRVALSNSGCVVTELPFELALKGA